MYACRHACILLIFSYWLAKAVRISTGGFDVLIVQQQFCAASKLFLATTFLIKIAVKTKIFFYFI